MTQMSDYCSLGFLIFFFFFFFFDFFFFVFCKCEGHSCRGQRDEMPFTRRLSNSPFCILENDPVVVITFLQTS